MALKKPCHDCAKAAQCVWSCKLYKTWFSARWAEIQASAQIMRGEMDMGNVNSLEAAIMVGLNSLEAGVATKREVLEELKGYVAGHYIAGHLEAMPLELAEQLYREAGITLDIRDGKVVAIRREDDGAGATAPERRGA